MLAPPAGAGPLAQQLDDGVGMTDPGEAPRCVKTFATSRSKTGRTCSTKRRIRVMRRGASGVRIGDVRHDVGVQEEEIEALQARAPALGDRLAQPVSDLTAGYRRQALAVTRVPDGSAFEGLATTTSALPSP